MKTRIFGFLFLAGFGLSLAPARAATNNGFGIAVAVNGEDRPEFSSRGAIYIEALRGSAYTLRLTNPLSCRVAVALSVDGLNTIDARHSDPWSAPKWILGPYETVTIPGWQVSNATARSFFFTGERNSYGALLGKTQNLGVIEAVFYRELAPIPAPRPMFERGEPGDGAPAPPASDAAPQPGRSGAMAQEKASSLSNEYAATGMGERNQHEVENVYLNLERAPQATLRLRYEFRPELVKLGVLPAWPTPLDRREGAAGFDRSFCPEPSR